MTGPACRRTCCQFVVLMTTAFVLCISSIVALAAGPISDPKSWADNLIGLVAARDADATIDALVAGGGGKRKPEDLKVVFAQLLEAMSGFGEISATELIAQREWGKSLVRYWYYLDYENKSIIVSLRLMKRGSSWELSNFNTDTDFDEAELP